MEANREFDVIVAALASAAGTPPAAVPTEAVRERPKRQKALI